jgi:hypothetical protein
MELNFVCINGKRKCDTHSGIVFSFKKEGSLAICNINKYE